VSLNSYLSVFDFIPNFQTLPCIIHLDISKQGFNQNAQMFYDSKCNQILHMRSPNSENPLSLSLSLSSSRREKKLKAPLNPTPKSP
jgi:hypothetical protein